MTGVPAPPPAGPGPLAETGTRDAVLAALAAEHAAIWSHGLASAFLPPTTTTALADAATAHRQRRDAVLAVLERAGVAPVTDARSSAGLLVVAEEDVAAAWRAVCEQTEAGDGATLRELAVDAVVASAREGVRWRRLAGIEPIVPVLPGVPVP